MALHLNLYHEIHTQAHQRARDPAKLAGLGAIVVLLLLVGYYFLRMGSVASTHSAAASMESRWRELQPKEIAAKARFEELVAQERVNQALINRIESRFYWAPVLARLANAVPPTVQIQELKADIIERGGQGRSFSLLISGVAADEVPRSHAEKFRQDIQGIFAQEFNNVRAAFDANSLEEIDRTFDYDGKTLNSAQFRIRLEFSPRPAPTPQNAGGTPK